MNFYHTKLKTVFEQIKAKLKTAGHHIKSNKGMSVALLLSVIAVGTSSYNTYLIKNGAIQTLGAGQIQAEAPEKILKELPKNSPVLGNSEAKVTIVEFGDFQCPFCGKFITEAYPEIKKQFIDTGKVKFIYLNYAFLGQESTDAAEAVMCAQEQGKYWEYHDELFRNRKGENQGDYNTHNLKKFAAELGLDDASFEACISDSRYDKRIKDELDLGKKYGVFSTPGFLIGRTYIKGAQPFTMFEKVINAELGQ